MRCRVSSSSLRPDKTVRCKVCIYTTAPLIHVFSTKVIITLLRDVAFFCVPVTFEVKTIAQDTPFVSARNTLRVELSFTGHLPAGSHITLSGLTESGTPDASGRGAMHCYLCIHHIVPSKCHHQHYKRVCCATVCSDSLGQ